MLLHENFLKGTRYSRHAVSSSKLQKQRPHEMHVLRYPRQLLQRDSSHEPRHVTQVKAFCSEEICGFLKSDEGIATML